MIISPGRGYIFVHIPKTGGTAMTLALEARAMRDDIILADTPKGRNRRRRIQGAPAAGRLWKHSRLADIEGLLSEAEMAASFVFTMVRNPWDRLVSYYHWLRAQRFRHPAVGIARQHDFAAFLRHAHTRATLRANPAAAYVRLPSGAEHCRLFLRLEHLEDEIAPLATHLGFRPQLRRENASERARDWRAYYSDADAGLVAELCAEDIARFGYGFDD